MHVCEVCGAMATRKGREFRDIRQLMDHLRNRHPDRSDLLEAHRKDALKAEKRERLNNKLNERAKREAARKRQAARVILTGDEIDEIQGEIQNLIGMMESYWVQGDCQNDAYDLIAKLEAKVLA